jgi:hypothetical protein
MKKLEKILRAIIKEELKSVITEKADFGGFDSQSLGMMKQRLNKASALYHNWSIVVDEFLWNVDTGSGDGKKLEKMIYNNRFKGQDSGKEIAGLMDDVFKQAIKHDKKK